MTECEESNQRIPEDAVKDAISLLGNAVAQTSPQEVSQAMQ